MRISKRIFPLFFITVLGGCAYDVQETSRLDVTLIGFSEQRGPSTEPKIAEVENVDAVVQADALNALAADLVRRSTVRGAVQGAAVGCGLAVVTGGNAKSCATGIAAGGLVGGVAGKAKGKRDVARRVELVSASALVRSLRDMNDQIEVLDLSLTDLLDEQDAELAALKVRREMGVVTDVDYAAGVDNIRQSRALIAEALTGTINRAEAAHANLEQATQQGQTGLHWHTSATSQVARDAYSARSRITLL
ncbi:MAG: hypothetical protein AAF214_04415 [Pseudomonadota bacterium]